MPVPTIITIGSVDEFVVAFPGAQVYRKSSDPDFPVLAVHLERPVKVKKPWGPEGSFVDVDLDPKTHVLLINCMAGEVYPCAKDEYGYPVGYIPGPSQPAVNKLEVMAFASEPIYASSPLETPVSIRAMEGVFEIPVGGRAIYSVSKGLYHVAAAQWVQLGFELVE